MANSRTGRIRRVFWLSTILVGISTIVIVGPMILHAAKERRAVAASQVKPISATDAEQREIIRAVLKSRSGLLIPPGSDGKPLVANYTAAICEPATGGDRAATHCGALPGADSISNTDLDAAIPRSLRLELIAANAHPSRLVDGHWDQADLSSYSSVAEALKEAGTWQRFYTTFPNSIGLVEFSRAVISNDGSHALIYVGHYAGGLAGRGSLQYLTRRDETWVISSVVGLWMS